MRTFFSVLALVLSVSFLSSFATELPAVNQMATESTETIDELTTWFTGEFNNYEQHAEELYAQKKDETVEPHHHVHSIFAPVELPALGSHVFHVQQSPGEKLDRVFRQRLYVFEPGEEETVEMKIYKYADPKPWMDVHKNPEKLVDLDISTLVDTGCKIIWEKSGERFVGTNEGGKCVTYSQRLKKNIVVEDTITLYKDQIWLLDNVYDEDRNLIMGRSDGEPAKLRRCVFYTGWAAIQENADLTQHTGENPPPSSEEQSDSSINKSSDAESEDSDENAQKPKPKRKYKGYFKLEFHNQGKQVVLLEKDGTKAGYDLSLSQVTYAGSQTAVLRLGLHKTGEKGTVYYIWAEPDANLLGMNLTWIQAGVTKVPDQLFGK